MISLSELHMAFLKFGKEAEFLRVVRYRRKRNKKGP
jgi:hypothetical protein